MRGCNKLRVETLEARDMPSSVFGNPWPNAQHLTLSFAPDGTLISGSGQTLFNQAQESGLFGEMAAAGNTTSWQLEILRAFQTWASQTNINIGLVPDGGRPFGPLSQAFGGVPGGNIRVGAFNTTTDVIAINQPYNILTGAWAGTLLYNSALGFSIGNTSSSFDIYSSTLNEAGNLLGLKDGLDPTSALYGHYIGSAGHTQATVQRFRRCTAEYGCPISTKGQPERHVGCCYSTDAVGRVRRSRGVHRIRERRPDDVQRRR